MLCLLEKRSLPKEGNWFLAILYGSIRESLMVVAEASVRSVLPRDLKPEKERHTQMGMSKR